MTQRTLVVKVGTSLLRAGDEFLHALAANLSAERQRGTRLVLVTSGAVGLGCNELGLTQRPQLVEELQAAAAIGQGQLMWDTWNQHVVGNGGSLIMLGRTMDAECWPPSMLGCSQRGPLSDDTTMKTGTWLSTCHSMPSSSVPSSHVASDLGVLTWGLVVFV